MNTFDDRPIDQASYAFQELIGQRPLGFPLGFVTLFPCVGVPSNAIGKNGDFALRQDGAAGTAIYQKRASVWTAIV